MSGIGVDGAAAGFLCGVKNRCLYFDTGVWNFCRQDQDCVADNQWHHFAVAYDEGTKTIKLYLDGENIYTDMGDLLTRDAPLLIGKSFTYPFDGQVANVKLFNRAVNSEEIIEIFNNRL